uniref:AMP-dependent synthetase/ligase domain-containing protein n=1 Tax=Dendroctonus ponderosae TaxID=77166 RepID=A0AAR5QGR9_DENPD
MVPSVFLRFTPEQIGEIFLNIPLKTLALGGEPFPAQLLAFKRHPQLKMYNLYGVTELSCRATIANLSTDDSTQEVPLGACLDETFVELRNQEEGLIGEICIGSKSRHCVLDAAPVGSPVPTGDLGEFISGRLYFRGRSSRSIKRFGRRVALQSVEDEIFLNTQLRSRLVYSTTHQRLLAFVVIAQPMDAPTKTRALDKLRVKLLNSLEEHCFPDYLEILTELPLNRHGKICDKSLEGLFKRGPKAGDVGDVFEDLLGGYVRAELQGHRDKTLAQLGVSSISIMQFMRDFQERVGDSRIGELLTLLLNEDVKTCREFVERHLEVSSGETCPVGTIGAAPSPSHVLWSVDMKGCVDAPVAATTSSLGTYIACGSFAHKVAILDESGHELFVVFFAAGDRRTTSLFAVCNIPVLSLLEWGHVLSRFEAQENRVAFPNLGQSQLGLPVGHISGLRLVQRQLLLRVLCGRHFIQSFS